MCHFLAFPLFQVFLVHINYAGAPKTDHPPATLGESEVHRWHDT